MAEEAIGNFNLLPLEIVSQIVELIPFCEKKKARLVCPRLRVMIDSPRSVAFRPKLTNNISMKYFLNSYCSMDHVILRNINKRKSKNVFGNLEFPRVKNAELGWKNSKGNIERFLTQGCEYAESITLAKFSLEKISRGAISKILSEIPWKNLTRFKVMVKTSNYKDTRVRKHLRNVTTLLKYARIPNLQELDFNFDFRYGFTKKHLAEVYRIHYEKLFIEFWSFLVGQSKTLKVLTGQINATSQCTLVIPQIPMDSQQSLISNMKLNHLSLSMRGVRQFDSTLNEALFGTDLKILDIKIDLPRNDRHLFERNLQLLFERNRKTLTNVSLELPVFPLTLLQDCAALESLKLERMFVFNTEEPENLTRLSQIKLKSFSARYMFSYTNVSPGAFQLLLQSVGTLEHLTLFYTPHHNPAIQFWLRDCVALKFLKIVHIENKFIEANMGAQFPHLTELETFLNTGNLRTAATWITESMRNLEMITTGPYTDLQLLQTLFTLPKLKRIIFADKEAVKWRGLLPNNVVDDIDEIKEFCATATPEVTFTTVKDGRKIGHYGKMHVITLHRPTVHNPHH